MRFLAEHLDLETLLGLTAQTQEFDGIEEVIVRIKEITNESNGS